MDVNRLFDPTNPGEQETYEFDFSLDMDVDGGETLISATWECTVRSGIDAGAAAHIGNGASPPSGATISLDGLRTQQACQGFLAGVVYILTARVVTSMGNTKILYAGLPCEAIA